MCGIAGFLSIKPGPLGFDPQRRLAGMIEAVRHRGPDHRGLRVEGPCGLGHARLSIIDLSPAGHQPMSGADNRHWVTYNGEIYNFRELRRELEAKGYVFRSHSDTETILHGYAAWGARVFTRLRGMFAIALWDAAERRLILARDRVGKKPLYYARLENFLVFGSEIKAILTWPGVDRSPDPATLDQYLSLGYASSPRTAFAAVRKVPPAHYMTVQLDSSGRAAFNPPARYWQLPPPGAAKQRLANGDLEHELVERLTEAVRLRMISDVPLGAFLSGGVDSSAIVALMSKIGAGPVKTFSIGFANPEYDETPYARRVARRYGTEHEEMIVSPDAAALIPRLVWQLGEPFADSSMVPTYCLAELARRHVTVALTGDGGDEDFLGYGRYQTCLKLQHLDSVSPALRRAAGQLMRWWPAGLNRRFAGRLNRCAELLAASDGRRSQLYAFTLAIFLDYHKREGYADAMGRFLAGSALDLLEPYFAEAPNLLTGANWADIHTYLPDDLMVKVDVATMANGLEARAPLLDHEFMEWAAGIPESVKMAGGATKSIFKRAMEPYLDRDLLYRSKMGFGCPIDHWFRGELKEMAYDVLLSPTATARGIFRRDYVQRLLDEHVSGANGHHARLWSLLVLELWFRMWVDRPGVALAA